MSSSQQLVSPPKFVTNVIHVDGDLVDVADMVRRRRQWSVAHGQHWQLPVDFEFPYIPTCHFAAILKVESEIGQVKETDCMDDCNSIVIVNIILNDILVLL